MKTYHILFIILFSFSFYQVGKYIYIPPVVSYSVIVIGMLLFLKCFNSKITKKSLTPLLSILLIILIDKYNDISYSFQIKTIASYLFSSCFVVLLYIVAHNRFYSYKAWKYLSISVFFTLIVGTLYFILINKDLATMARDISTLYLFFTVNLYFINKKVFYYLTPVVMYFLIYIVEARAQALGLFLFLVALFFIKDKTSTRLLLIYTTIVLMLVFPVIYYAIYFEYYLAQGGTNLFTGRGLIWHYVSDYIMNSNYMYTGAPSTVESLNSFFSTSAESSIRTSERVIDVVKTGDFHSLYIYLFYNTGIIGLTLFIFSILYIVKNRLINYRNIILLFVLMVNFLLMGKSFYGFSILGMLFLVTLIVPLTTKDDLINAK